MLALIVFFAAGAHAQWLNYPTPGTPRTRDGKPNLAAPVPRALDGKPDLTGVWAHETTSIAEVRRLFGAQYDAGTQHKYAFNILADFKPAEAPVRPEQAQRLPRATSFGPGDPAAICTGVMGFPLAGFLSEPIKIVQAPRLTIVLYEAGYLHRQIFTDGRALPKEFDFPAFLGYSAGHWERDTLVVETAGFNDRTVLDMAGHRHSEALRVTERFHRRDFGHLDVEMTFDDPMVYTKPFTIKIPHELVPDNDIYEMFCENEKDRAHLGKK
jgi:hypothetical protein